MWDTQGHDWRIWEVREGDADEICNICGIKVRKVVRHWYQNTLQDQKICLYCARTFCMCLRGVEKAAPKTPNRVE